MTFRYLDKDGAISFWTNIKNYILSKIPTKTSELTNDSGFLTSHQSLSNYVTIDTAQDIEGNKNFKGLLTTIPNDTIWPVTASTTDDITYLGANAIHVEQKSSGKLTDLSNGAWSVAELGVGCFFFRINNGTDIRYKHLGKNTVNRIPVVSGANRFINDVTPNENNTYSLGTSSLRWSSCYSNAYYLGTTAFGDIVTHNASEFLTEHPSITLSSNTTSTASPAHGGTFTCIDSVTQDTNGHITKVNTKTVTLPSDNNTDTKVKQYEGTTNNERPILSRYNSTEASQTANFVVYDTGVTSNPAKHTITASGGFVGNASSATEFSANKDVTLTGDVTGTASSKAGWSVATTLANSGVTAGTYGPSADASPAHSGTFTVPSITVDAKGRITAASTKTITLPADNNTDTKVTQTVTTANSGYPVLLCATANATATGTTTSRFSAGLTVNTRYSSIYMTNKYDTANTKGVRNTSNYNNGILYFRSYDETQMGTIRCESNKGGYQQIYMMASNYIKNGAIDPEGTSTTCLITVRVRDNGSKTIYTDGSWENSLTPYANNTYSLGTSSLRWKECYSNAYYLGTTAFGDIVTHNASEFLTSADLLPIGSYIQFAGSQPPDGFLVCNGGEISRTTYSALFAVIGTTYGSGDGSTTFNLPDLTDRFLQGSTTSGTVKDAGLPNITGSHNRALASNAIRPNEMNGYEAFSITHDSKTAANNSSSQYFIRLAFDASRSNSIYGNSSTVQPPALTCLICIKY